MKERHIFKSILSLIYKYIIFFAIVAFVVTCCMLLFLSTLDIVWTEKNMRTAATLTFGNVLLISFLATVIDTVRRKLTVDRMVKHIGEAAKQITRGDFSVRIKPGARFMADENFNEIIDCFNTLAQELSGVETLRTDFIANVSHELKTPLAVIQNYAAMLQKPDLTEEKRVEYAKTITESTRRLADLIANILKLNRLENQQIYPDKQIYNLGEQLCECLLNFEDTWEKKEIEINTEIEGEVFIESDPELLTLVWNNLFSNAMKFTEPGGTISLRLRLAGELAVVEVSDTGCGISPEVGRHIFEKFYQGDTSHAAQGNGLGLALVKRVMDIVGGDISVSSEVGEGSTFTVKIRRKRNGTVQTDI